MMVTIIRYKKTKSIHRGTMINLNLDIEMVTVTIACAFLTCLPGPKIY